jgi:hypothetical protein
MFWPPENPVSIGWKYVLKRGRLQVTCNVVHARRRHDVCACHDALAGGYDTLGARDAVQYWRYKSRVFLRRNAGFDT